MTVGLFLTKLTSQNYDSMHLQVGGHGGLVTLRSLLTLQNKTRTLNFQSNEASSKLI